MNIRAAIFDMDGTIINSLFYWEDKWKELGRRYLGVSDFVPPAQIDKNVRTMKLRECACYVRDALGLHADDDEIFDFFGGNLLDFYRKKANVKDGMECLLPYLQKKGIRMCIATATAADTAKEVIRYFGLDGYFTHIVSCDDADVNRGKDSPKVYEKALRLLGTEPDETLIFEDSDTALRTAQTLGLHTVGIEDRYNANTEKLRQYAELFIGKDENIFDGFAGRYQQADFCLG